MTTTEDRNRNIPPNGAENTPRTSAPGEATAPVMPPELTGSTQAPEAEKRRFSPTITAPLLVFCIFVLLLAARLLSPLIFDRDNEVILLTVVQVLIFMLPAGIYMRLCRVRWRRLRIFPFGVNHLLLIISAIVAAATGALLFEYAVSGYEAFSNVFTLYGAFSAPAANGAGSTLYLAVVYAALPAFCEEFVFRSLLCSEYESGGSFSAVVLTSVWFAMLHFDLRSLPVYLFSGLLLALTLYAARSFFAAFAVHLGYNLISLFGAPLWRTVYDAGGKKLYFLIIGLLFLISMFVFCGECARLYSSYADRNLPSDYRLPSPGSEDAALSPLRRAFAGNARAFLAPSALLCYLFYIAVMLFTR